MREILFRGKTESGQWIYGGYYTWSDRQHIVQKDAFDEYDWDAAIILVVPETVGQFTGLLDKNGRRIFEGDVVRIFNIIAVIEYYLGSACYLDKSPNNFGHINIHNSNITIDNDTCREIEVIGNIHDNSELLGIK